MTIRIYHNPRCSKSRKALELIRQHGEEPEIVEYLENPPTVNEIERILDLLECEPRDIMRSQEPEYAANGLADQSISRETLVRTLQENPRLLERPIVVSGTQAVLGRPPENVLRVLDT